MEPRRPSVRWVIAAAIIVFAIAAALRMPSCYESFWLDELHSAWTVWGELSDVAPRAEAGHQTPLYFVGLWYWKQIAGDSELALRMSSVIATSLACVVLTIGVARWTRSLTAGVTSGLVLALESNSIFFGTELRPYAFVIFFASIVQVCFLCLMDSKSRFEQPFLWAVLIIAVLSAGLTQPTAIGVLMLFPIVLLGHWSIHDRRELTRIGMLDALLLLSTATTAFAIWRTTLGESWQQRSQWAAFGSATNLRQIANAWDWLWLLIVPLGIAGIAAMVSRRCEVPSFQGKLCRRVLALALMATGATCLYWLVSWLEWAPIWHRRYFIAVLPVFATVCGVAVGAVQQVGDVRQSEPTKGQATTLAVGIAGLLLLGLGLRQATLQALPKYPVALAVRGEEWREAIRWVNETAGTGEPVFLDPGLIEQTSLFSLESRPSSATGSRVAVFRPLTPAMTEYLLFPVSGPYKVDRTVGIFNTELDVFMSSENPSLVYRSGSRLRRQWIIVRGQPKRYRNMRRGTGTMVPFGGVSVIIKLGARQPLLTATHFGKYVVEI